MCPKYDFMATHLDLTCVFVVCFFFFCIQVSAIFFHIFCYLKGYGRAEQLMRHIWHFLLSKGKPTCEAWAAWAVQSSLTSYSRSCVPQLLNQLWAEGLGGGFELPPQEQGRGQAPGEDKALTPATEEGKHAAQPFSRTDFDYLLFSLVANNFPLLSSLPLCPDPTDACCSSLIFSASWCLLQQDSRARAAQ